MRIRMAIVAGMAALLVPLAVPVTASAVPVTASAVPVTASAVPVTASAGGGNSEAAKRCQKGGWTSWVRDDGTSFKNAGDCVSYAAHGGALMSQKSPAQIACEGFGGTFGNDNLVPIAPGYSSLWTCNGLPPDTVISDIQPLVDICLAGGGTSYGLSGGVWSPLGASVCIFNNGLP